VPAFVAQRIAAPSIPPQQQASPEDQTAGVPSGSPLDVTYAAPPGRPDVQLPVDPNGPVGRALAQRAAVQPVTPPTGAVARSPVTPIVPQRPTKPPSVTDLAEQQLAQNEALRDVATQQKMQAVSDTAAAESEASKQQA